jgi:hypothetical protein
MATTRGPSQTTGPTHRVRYPAGQRLHCTKCGSEVEIINPCTCDPPELILQCCGRAMQPQPGQNVHVSAE